MRSNPDMRAIRAMRIGGILLAGGQSRRMGGGDKCLLPLGGMPLLEHARKRLEPQVEWLVLNANGDPARFAEFGMPVLADGIEGFAGPLAGILAGLRWAQSCHPQLSHIATVPCDTPFFPGDVVARLCATALESGTPLACASSNGRTHPVFGLWPVSLVDDLEQAMIHEDLRKIDLWTNRHGVAHACFEASPFDPFFNINHPDDLIEASAMLMVMDQPQYS